VTATDDDLLAVAVEAARRAAPLLVDRFGHEHARATKSSPTDLVSDADIAAERTIRDLLRERRPDDGILGEEGDDLAGSSGRRWVVDPLDGTVNFLFGLPQWAVSVAVEDGDGVLAGAVYDPMRDECWTAMRGGQAALDGVPVAASDRADLATSLIATGFGYDAAVREVQAATVARLLPLVRDIRRFGSAALDLAWTAGGRYDGYYERGVHHWDVAAGELLCRCAGLEVRALEAAPPSGPGVLVATPAIVDELLALVS
jgi:myo-inositol-1(or 4)-monophosphatase